jgi:hypothetical protein
MNNTKERIVDLQRKKYQQSAKMPSNDLNCGQTAFWECFVYCIMFLINHTLLHHSEHDSVIRYPIWE